MNNEDLHLLASFMNYTITSKPGEEVWYLIKNESEKNSEILWEPHKNRDQAQSIVNKINMNALTMRHYQFLYDVCIETKSKVELLDAVEIFVKIVKLVNQLKND